jgi:predicted DNA-binding transcriptional regulator AlpA
MTKPELRPPAFMSKATLARELDCAESTVDELVRRGIIPKPAKLTSGMVRWAWADVEPAVRSLLPANGSSTGQSDDPYTAAADRHNREQMKDDTNGKPK